MKDFFKKLSMASVIVFIGLFVFLLLSRAVNINISPRHKKVLEVLLMISLAIVLVALSLKSISGYRKIIRNKDRDMLKELFKIIILVLLVSIVFGFISNRKKIFKIDSIYRNIKLVLFIVTTVGISYDEMIK